MKKIKTAIAATIGIIPVNSIKCFLYRTVLGYKIGKNVKIGLSLINCDKVTIGGQGKNRKFQ